MQDSKVSGDSGTGAPGQDFSTVKSIMLPRGTIFGLHCFAFLRAILAASYAASHSSFPIKAFMRRNYAQESYEPNKRSSHIRFLGRYLTMTEEADS
jgi:hypothetical protein